MNARLSSAVANTLWIQIGLRAVSKLFCCQSTTVGGREWHHWGTVGLYQGSAPYLVSRSSNKSLLEASGCFLQRWASIASCVLAVICAVLIPHLEILDWSSVAIQLS